MDFIEWSSHLRPERVPLSHAQQRLWLLDRLQGGSTEYNLSFCLRLVGPLDRAALVRATIAIVQRHESLRTRFEERDGEPVQVVDPRCTLEVPVVDLTSFDPLTRQTELLRIMTAAANEPFDLARGPLLRMMLIQCDAHEHVLLQSMHHIVWDWWSQNVFCRELAAYYSAFRAGQPDPLPPMEVQYPDFAVWLRAHSTETEDAGLTYWREQLAGIPEELLLPADRSRPAVPSFEADAYEVTLGPDALARLKDVGRSTKATLFMTLLASFGALLSRYTGQDDLVVGSPIANRSSAVEGMIGFFVNMLLMRMRVHPRTTFRELLSRVRVDALGAYEHQDTPFERLVQELSPQRTLSANPLFQVTFTVGKPFRLPALDGLDVTLLPRVGMRVRVDLELRITEGEHDLTFYWLYDRHLFDGWRIGQMAEHYVRVLHSISTNADIRVEDIELLDAGERQQMLVRWNDTSRQWPRATLPGLLEEQALRSPDAVAVVG